MDTQSNYQDLRKEAWQELTACVILQGTKNMFGKLSTVIFSTVQGEDDPGRTMRDSEYNC